MPDQPTSVWPWSLAYCPAITSPSNLNQLFAGGGQNLAASLRNQNHIFNSYTPSTGEVNSGLNRDHHTRLQDFSLPGADTRTFVNFQTYAVTTRAGKIVL